MDEGFTLWFTGLSGAGKSTLAQSGRRRVARSRPSRRDCSTATKSAPISPRGWASPRKIATPTSAASATSAKLLARNGVVAISAAISPYREIRDEVAQVARPLLRSLREVLARKAGRRDVKGLYKKALKGEIASFTGVSDPYEEPLHPELVIESDRETPRRQPRQAARHARGSLNYIRPQERCQERHDDRAMSATDADPLRRTAAASWLI